MGYMKLAGHREQWERQGQVRRAGVGVDTAPSLYILHSSVNNLRHKVNLRRVVWNKKRIYLINAFVYPTA